jgi:hypothetical protein
MIRAYVSEDDSAVWSAKYPGVQLISDLLQHDKISFYEINQRL